MAMQVIPTFKSMNLTAPLAQQQLLMKRNQDLIANMLESWKINGGFNTVTKANGQPSAQQLNIQALQDMMKETAGRKNDAAMAIGHRKETPQTEACPVDMKTWFDYKFQK
jgi:hypothetical protein